MRSHARRFRHRCASAWETETGRALASAGVVTARESRHRSIRDAARRRARPVGAATGTPRSQHISSHPECVPWRYGSTYASSRLSAIASSASESRSCSTSNRVRRPSHTGRALLREPTRRAPDRAIAPRRWPAARRRAGVPPPRAALRTVPGPSTFGRRSLRCTPMRMPSDERTAGIAASAAITDGCGMTIARTTPPLADRGGRTVGKCHHRVGAEHQLVELPRVGGLVAELRVLQVVRGIHDRPSPPRARHRSRPSGGPARRTRCRSGCAAPELPVRFAPIHAGSSTGGGHHTPPARRAQRGPAAARCLARR